MEQKSCLSLAEDFFNELGSWIDSSQTQFSATIDLHNAKIINGIGNLVAEVGGLHSQLSITTNERNVLVETVKNLNKEIRNLKSELINQQSFPDLRDKRDEPISKLEEKHVKDTEPLQDKENQEQDDKHYEKIYNS